jgi:hypothetical protein
MTGEEGAGMTGEEGMWGNLQVVRQEWDLHKRRIGIGIWSIGYYLFSENPVRMGKDIPPGVSERAYEGDAEGVGRLYRSDVAVDTPVTISAPSLAAFTTIS